MLIEYTLFGKKIDKVNIAIERLRQFEPTEGYFLAFSGGKDSVVIKALADMSGVKYDTHYNNTTIDPPELVKFIREYHKDVIFENPEEPFLRALISNGFPTRLARWCCRLYKENGGSGRLVVTGIRWEESLQRKNRNMVEVCYRDTTKKYLNIIIDWTTMEVWEFIHKYKLPYCCLYNEGWKRVGCLMCPYSSPKQRLYHTKRYPKYTRAFIKAFNKLYEDRKNKGSKAVDNWGSGEEMFWWWVSNSPTKKSNQRVMFE